MNGKVRCIINKLNAVFYFLTIADIIYWCSASISPFLLPKGPWFQDTYSLGIHFTPSPYISLLEHVRSKGNDSTFKAE